MRKASCTAGLSSFGFLHMLKWWARSDARSLKSVKGSIFFTCPWGGNSQNPVFDQIMMMLFILSTAEIYPKVYHICFFIVTYFAPLCLMVLAYIQICHKLWFQQVCIPELFFFLPKSKLMFLWRVYTTWCLHILNQQIPGSTSVLQRKWRSMQCSVPTPGLGEPVRVRTSTVCAEIKQVRARRKTARMLMVVLVVFALCYLPISVLNVMKR